MISTAEICDVGACGAPAMVAVQLDPDDDASVLTFCGHHWRGLELDVMAAHADALVVSALDPAPALSGAS